MIICDIDLGAPELQAYCALTQKQAHSEGVFIAESINVIQSALDAGIKPLSLLCERRHAEGKAAELIKKLGDIPVYTPPDEAIKKLTGYELSRGVLCAMERPIPMTADEALADAHCCAVMENVRDETNLGAIFRSAAALGMDAVMLCGSCSDPLSRRAARVSTGAVFRLPWARLPALSEGGAEILKRRGFTLCALALSDRSEGPEALANAVMPAVVLGNEGEGLSREAVACCDITVRIPMRRGVDSLNVSAAAAIAFWEAGKRG
ncbi:MAG: RNA methyltransferase [Clostridiales bacterium]|nr:RNA methyltransferase [Clostridiales bacterium]